MTDMFDQVAQWAVAKFGSATAFVLAVSIVAAWGVSGPLFGFSDTWQLVINTSTTIVTFLMVFLLQHSQNKDSHAIHAKLNELIAATEGASNRLIDLEELTEEEIDHIRRRFQHLCVSAEKLHPGEKTSIDGEADDESPDDGKTDHVDQAA
ncbi:MAG: low affinity iron permease family protein [Planctomycetia bacterium]|nr:low affinity iron permease family protein [Planctomycetia bacterium]